MATSSMQTKSSLLEHVNNYFTDDLENISENNYFSANTLLFLQVWRECGLLFVFKRNPPKGITTSLQMQFFNSSRFAEDVVYSLALR